MITKCINLVSSEKERRHLFQLSNYSTWFSLEIHEILRHSYAILRLCLCRRRKIKLKKVWKIAIHLAEILKVLHHYYEAFHVVVIASVLLHEDDTYASCAIRGGKHNTEPATFTM